MPEPERAELLRCPFCGGKGALKVGPLPRVFCLRCDATGPSFKMIDEHQEYQARLKAVQAWNVRV